MADKSNKMPAVVWLKMTDYLHGWLQHELGGSMRIKDQLVVSVQHLDGAREVLRMESVSAARDHKPVGNSMSGRRKNCIETGLDVDPETVIRTYGVTKTDLRLFVPVECPKMCMTKDGTLRPWTLDINYGRQQAAAMQKLLRDRFWDAVAAYDREYAKKMDGRKYPAVDMIESFCTETGTPDLYVDAMRREWQRRIKREK